MIIRGKIFKMSKNVLGGSSLRVDKGIHFYNEFGGELKLGRRVKLYRNVGIYLHTPKAKIFIGEDTYINHRTELRCYEKINIGNRCAISWDVTIMDTDYHQIDTIKHIAPTIIEDHVWVGCKSVILKGVTIGEGSIVAAGSIVTKNVPPYTLVAGNPAKVIKEKISWN